MKKTLFMVLAVILSLVMMVSCEEEPVAVTGVTISKTETTISVGETETLTATVAPSDATKKSVTWTSSNTDVATVDADGVVTAVSAGEATITVTTVDGGKTATCTVTVPYRIGDRGPAGGWIFYDCDADNTEEDPDGADNLLSSVCGWRYLEAAPANISVTVDSVATTTFVYGYYRTNGTTNLKVGTGLAVGRGSSNTTALVTKMGDSAYNSYGETTANYAAKLCADYSISNGGVTYDDWFLPSYNELNLMYQNLIVNGDGSFSLSGLYWSSSEKTYNEKNNAFLFSFSSGTQTDVARGSLYPIRAARAF